MVSLHFKKGAKLYSNPTSFVESCNLIKKNSSTLCVEVTAEMSSPKGGSK